jgi:hypothetical protein
MAADVVLQWNQAVLQAIRNDKPTIGFGVELLAGDAKLPVRWRADSGKSRNNHGASSTGG